MTDPEDVNQLRKLVADHLELTDSVRARDILDRWDEWLPKFIKVISKAEPVQVPLEEEPADEPVPAKA